MKQRTQWTGKRLLALFMSVVMALSVMVLPAAAETSSASTPTQPVQDNLVLWLDAENNTGTGTYDSTATTWTNLAKKEQQIKLNGQSWGKNTDGAYLQFTNNYIILPDEVRQAIGGENFTVEFVMEDYTSKDSSNIINVMAVTGDDEWIATATKDGTPNDNFVLFVSQGDTQIKFRTCYGATWSHIMPGSDKYSRVDGTKVDQKTNTITFDHDDQSIWYLDGTVATNGTTANNGHTIGVDGFKVNGTWQTERTPQVVFGACCDTVSGRSFNAKVKAIRVYKDTLTADEAAQNAAYDQAHYYSDDASTADSLVPDGYVTDDLVLFLDANLNNGESYSASADKWVDLSDATGSTKVDVSGKSWGGTADDGGRYLDLNGYIKLPEKVRQAIASGEFTIEFLVEDVSKNSSVSQNIMTLTGSDEWLAANASTNPTGGTKNDNFVIYQNYWESSLNFKINTDGKPRAQLSDITTVNGATNAITFAVGSKAYWYQNAAQVSVSKDTYAAAPDVASWDGTTPQVLFGAAVDAVAGRAFSGHVKTIRVYSKTLTDAQLKANARQDALRYAEKSDSGNVPAGYVTDDLVLFLDSKNNTGDGYSAGTTTTWTNLANTEETATFLSGGSNTYTWSEDGLSANGAVILPQSALEAVAGSNFTVEFLVDNYDASKETSVIRNLLCLIGPDSSVAGSNGGTWDDDFVAFQNSTTANSANAHQWCFDIKNTSSKQFGRVQVDASSINTCTNALAFDKTKSIIWYQDGVSKSTGNAGASSSWETGINTTNGTRLIFGAASGYMTNRAFSGQIKAIRVYSDTLTAAELAANAAMDYARYYAAGTDHTHQFDSEWTQTATDHYYKCIVSGCDVQYKAGTHVYDNDDDATCNVCGYKRSIKSVSTSYDVDLYEPDTDVNTAPIAMQAASSTVSDVSGETKRPSAMLFDVKVVDGTLKAYPYRSGSDAEALGNFADLYKANQPKANVGVRVNDKATATALAAWVKAEKVGNLWVISNDVEQLKTVTDSMSTVRGVVDFTGDTVRGPANIKYNFDTNGDGTVNSAVGGEYANNAKRTYEWKTFEKGSKDSVYANMDWADVYDLVFAEGYRTILIPESEATADHVYFLQGSLVYTIVESDAATDVDYYDLITTGANGVIVNDYAKYIDVLESDTFDVDGQNILLRGGSIVGHRGDMGNAVKNTLSLPENSIEAIVSAAESSASSVEFDMYMTTDGELVTNHNASVAGYFVYADDCPLPADQRVSDSVPITQRAWYGDLEYLVSTYNKTIPMQRLQDLYEAVDNEYPDLRLHHEIKDGRTETLNRTIELMDQYGLRDRSDMMCFTKSVVAYVESMGISAQYLSSVSKYTDSNRAYNMELQYRDVNSTWHATWGDINVDFLEEMKHFGQTAYPWPTDYYNNGSYYQLGYQGFTTNAPHHLDDNIRALTNVTLADDGTVTATAYTLAKKTQTGTAPAATGKFGGEGYQAITLPDYLEDWWITQGISDGKTSYTLSDGLEIVVLEGKDNVNVNGNVITKKDGAASGDATIAVRYKQTVSGGGSYYMYSQAVKVTAKEYAHTHAWSTEWSTNANYHWHVCTAKGCLVSETNQMNGYGAHVYDDENDSTCNTCGYVRAIARVPGEYVSDGLVLFLDGVDNTAAGYHDSTASSWVNLANIAQAVAIPDGTAHSGVKGVWGSNYLDLDGYIKLPDTVRETLASGEFTIEFVMDDYVGTTNDSKNIRNIMTLTGSDTWIAANSSANPTKGTQNDNFVIYQNNGQQDVNFKINSDGKPRAHLNTASQVNDKTNAITFAVGSKANWYQDAVLTSTSNDTYSAAPSVDKWDGTTAQVVFGAAVDVVANRAFSGNVKAIRIYDRVLSTSELASNATADSTRYADSASKTDVTITGVTAASDLTYTGSKQTGYTGTPTSAYTGTYVVNYTGRNGTSYGPSTVAPTNAGDYTVTFAVPATDATYTGSASVNFSIAPKAVTVTADSKSMYQYETLPTWTYQVSGLLNGDQLTKAPQLTCSADGKTSGTFDIVASGADAGSNYTVSYQKGTLTVTMVSSSSSSGSSLTTSPVSVGSTSNGTVTVSPKNASKGSTVTVTVKPNSGYELKDLTVTDKDGNELKLTQKSDGKYTFTMPAGKVTVSPSFVKTESETGTASGFVDVPESAYFYDAVEWAVAEGVTQGTDATHFSPSYSCTRAHMVTFLWRAAGCPVVDYAMDFSDVVEDVYCTEAIRWANSLGIVGGYGDGRFGTNDTITRQQMAVILYRFAQSMDLDIEVQGGKDIREFAGYEYISDYALTAVQWAVDVGIMQGDNGHLYPTMPCTRAQIVTMMYRLLNA